jgi:Zn finger protein HypA/HybF involved in hydrogenase expression
MFFKCLDCGSVMLDPDLNISECPVCGSVNFAIEQEQAAEATPCRSGHTITVAIDSEKVSAL